MSDVTSDSLNTLLEEFANNFEKQDKEYILSQLSNEQMDFDFTLIDNLSSWFLNIPA